MFSRFLPTAAALLLGFASTPGSAQTFETKAATAFMVDADTGSILFSKDPDKPIPPASLAKLMTTEMVFRAVEAGERSLDDTFPVSEHAWRTGGAPAGVATMFAALKSSIRLEDLIQGMVVQGANDACIVIAEGFAGSEEKFAGSMNERAKALGLESLAFGNPTGLPADGQVATMRDMASLGLHIWREYPDLYKYYAQPDFTWNKITQRNRNPLLTLGIGADGMGVGFTEGVGYSIVASVSRNGRHVVAALGGLANERERTEETRKMLDWGIDAFEKVSLFSADGIIGEASVFGGAKSGVVLKAKAPVAVLLPAQTSDRLSARIVYQGPVIAPVEVGTPVGSLQVSLGDRVVQETPLFAAEAVELGTIRQRAFDAIAELAIGWTR